MKVSFAFAFDFALSLKTTHVSIDQRIMINTMIIIWVSLFFFYLGVENSKELDWS